jgi:hypothetical protein
MSDDGLNYTPAAGYSAEGPNSSQQPETPPAAQPQHEIYDPPIEHDPIGQALVGLPVALLTGVGEGVAEGAGMLANVGKEVLAWGAGELGIGAGESLLEDGHGGDGGDGAGGAPAGGDPDAGTGGDSSGDGSGGDGSGGYDDSGDGGGDSQDPGMCVDPSQDDQADYSSDYSGDDSGQ